MDGRMEEWRDGVRRNGEMESGRMERWRVEGWRDGEWRNGEWRDGEWKDGEWKDGEWKDGEWKDGEWKDGEWRDGEWRDGRMEGWRVEGWKNGGMEEWRDGGMEGWKLNAKDGRMERKNINRGFTQLRVWNDAIDLYVITCKILNNNPFELKKTAGNCIDSSHSISRNIAEGYSRRSIKEYLNFLNISLGSCGEYYSCIISFYKAEQITKEEFNQMDKIHYKTENGLIQLIKSLQKKMKDGSWIDTL